MMNRTAVVAIIALVIGYFLGRVGSSPGACAPSLNPVPATASAPQGANGAAPKSDSPKAAEAGGGASDPASMPAQTVASERPKFEDETRRKPPRFIVIDFSEKNVGQMEADAVSFGKEFEVKKSDAGWVFTKVPASSLLYRLGLRAGDSIYTIQVDDLRSKRPDLEARVRAMLDNLS